MHLTHSWTASAAWAARFGSLDEAAGDFLSAQTAQAFGYLALPPTGNFQLIFASPFSAIGTPLACRQSAQMFPSRARSAADVLAFFRGTGSVGAAGADVPGGSLTGVAVGAGELVTAPVAVGFDVAAASTGFARPEHPASTRINMAGTARTHSAAGAVRGRRWSRGDLLCMAPIVPIRCEDLVRTLSTGDEVALRGLLSERTFATLSVAEIISAAGISGASFYFYFAGKQAVLAELVRRAVGAGHEAAQPWVQSTADPYETLRAGVDAGAGLWLANAGVPRAIVESWASDPHLRELWLTQTATFTEAAITRIDADRRADPAVAARLAGVDVPALAASLTCTGERPYYLAASGVPPFDDRTTLVNTLTHLWVSALYD